MKYLLILVTVAVVLWMWRSRQTDKNDAPPVRKRQRAELPPAEIVACAVCDLHLPRTEALPGPNGLYCSEAHRRQGEG